MLEEAQRQGMEAEGFCAGVGRKLLGCACDDVERGVARIVELVRAYPIRPYRIEGGGSGFTVQRGQWRDDNWHIVKEFSCLWWSAAGDAVIAQYGNRLPIRPAEHTAVVYGLPPETADSPGARK